jgi:hypothetical protein
LIERALRIGGVDAQEALASSTAAVNSATVE